MPDFEHEILDDFARAGREVIAHLPHLHHAVAAATQTPATQPVNLAAATAAADNTGGTPMSLATILDDVKTAISNADDWAKQAIETHLPALAAEAEKYAASPVVQALESAFLTPAEEQQIASLIGMLAAKAQPAAATAEPAQAPAQ